MAAVRTTKKTIKLGKLTLGRIPRVVSTVLSPKFNPTSGKWRSACDAVELRLDQMPGLKDWLRRGQAAESHGVPVIVTIRLKAEGGAWKRADKARLPLYDLALKNLSAVDVELQSDIVEEVSALAKKRHKCCIVSFHDFKKTPTLSELKRVAAKAQKLGSVVKIVTMLTTEADVDTLWSLLACKWTKPICVMGMGDFGKETRLVFPTMGSCLTYGYLDMPAAPGQLSAARLVERLRKLLPAYDKDVRVRRRAQ